MNFGGEISQVTWITYVDIIYDFAYKDYFRQVIL